MTRKPRRTLTLAIYGVSVALHVALAAGAVLAPKAKRNVTVAISLAEAKKPPPKKDDDSPPPPPPPPPVKAKAAPVRVAAATPKPAPAPVAAEPAPAAANAAPDSFADLGLTLGNGTGGMAVPVAARPTAPPQRETTRKVRTLSAAHEDTCDEPIVKAKLRGAVVKPAYTDDARRAQIEGVVRVEMTVDEQGTVVAVKVLKGLGYGLDEAAMKAAKQMTFEAGTRCGKASVTKLTVGMRFALQQ